MHLVNGHSDTRLETVKPDEFKKDSSDSHSSTLRDVKMEPTIHMKREPLSQSPEDALLPHEEVVGGDVTLKLEPGQPPKLARSSSHKVMTGPAQLYTDEPDRTEEARRTFEVLSECSYSSKYIGSSSHDYMECDCTEEWGEIHLPGPSVAFSKHFNSLSR